MEGVRYRKNELTLAPGDAIYLYTDGVTEATNMSEELYGEERLKKVLDEHKDEAVEKICAEVKKDVDEFVGEAPQFDDITMLAIRYKGEE
jgi:serine phosphatase RsbU (regulator of sigma subunit)